MKRLMFALALCALTITGCSSSGQSSELTPQPVAENNTTVETAPATDERILIDDLGIAVELPENIERVLIADLPPLVHTFRAIAGSSDLLVGIPSDYVTSGPLLTTMFPDLNDVNTGFREGGVLNIETALALEPDLILYRADNPETIELIQNTGVPAVAFRTYNLDNGNTVPAVASWVDKIAYIVEKDISEFPFEAYAYEVMGFVQSRLWDVEPITSAYLKVTPEGTDVFGKGLFGAFWSQIIHTTDLGAALTNGSQQISIEELYNMNPDIIFTGLSTVDPKEFMSDPVYAELDAVKNDRVHHAPEGVFTFYGPSIDVPISFLWHAKLAYPEYFEDVDVIDCMKKYYVEMYGYTLTDADIEYLFGNDLDKLYAAN